LLGLVEDELRYLLFIGTHLPFRVIDKGQDSRLLRFANLFRPLGGSKALPTYLPVFDVSFPPPHRSLCVLSCVHHTVSLNKQTKSHKRRGNSLCAAHRPQIAGSSFD
jgi:hypothetical protein